MDEHPLIGDHGLIGDLQTAALVSTEGTIDWFCSPRFDSPSIFGALLDSENGGHWTITPQAPTYAAKQLYHPDTCVLLTRFMTEQGVGSVVDFMPPASPSRPTDRHRLVRMMRCTRGEITFDIDIAPRFDYGRQPHEVTTSMGGWHFAGRDREMTVHVVDAPGDECVGDRRIRAGDVCMTVELRAGATRGLVLEAFADGPPRVVPPEECERLLRPQAPRWLSTLDAITKDLVSDGLVYRYDPSASPDGVLGSEGTFSACTFWCVEALARSGRLHEARLVFEKMLTYANHLGLYSEEIGLTGEQLGNFPQALTHLALISGALSLDAHLDAARPGFPPTSMVPVPFLHAWPMTPAAGGPPVSPTTPCPPGHVTRR